MLQRFWLLKTLLMAAHLVLRIHYVVWCCLFGSWIWSMWVDSWVVWFLRVVSMPLGHRGNIISCQTILPVHEATIWMGSSQSRLLLLRKWSIPRCIWSRVFISTHIYFSWCKYFRILLNISLLLNSESFDYIFKLLVFIKWQYFKH